MLIRYFCVNLSTKIVQPHIFPKMDWIFPMICFIYQSQIVPIWQKCNIPAAMRSRASLAAAASSTIWFSDLRPCNYNIYAKYYYTILQKVWNVFHIFANAISLNRRKLAKRIRELVYLNNGNQQSSEMTRCVTAQIAF